MEASVLVGDVLIVLGVVAIAAGIAISVVEALRPSAAPEALMGDITSLLEAITKLLAELAKFKPGMQLLLVGIAIFAVGAWLVATKPF